MRSRLRCLVIILPLLAAACAPSDPRKTHVCTETPNGLAECHLIDASRLETAKPAQR
ncbi:hypothetical protein [Stappia sp. WLB 29]|uniref:hypothetical protein n=1 Tax=Stappia sp. WLB 29 TaxID=2925220 RepID=UPI0020BECB29|nr:hypothetical protein [Stappia sp. WLB 29]